MAEISPRARRILWWIGGLSALALATVLVLHAQTRLDRELRDLPDPERHALYERTLETLRSSCMRSTGPTFTEYCRAQADFIERFPGCDSECHELARRFTQTNALTRERCVTWTLVFITIARGLVRRSERGARMTSMLVIGGVLALLLFAYLGFALLFPERFS